MRSLKKITSLLLAIMMLCSVVSFADKAAVAETDEVVEVVNTDAYTAAVKKLNALGFWIYGDSNDGSVAVKRGEFAYLAANLVDMADYEGEEQAIFRDVPTTHPYFQSISFMYDIGVISGEVGALFRPDDAITYAEAIKILTFVMGYEGEANDKGGFPTGYILVANRLGVKVSGLAADDILTRSSCATALEKAITADVVAKIVYSTRFVLVSTNVKSSLLAEYYDIYEASGVVEAVGSTRATVGDKIHKDIAEIDDVLFDVGSSNVRDYIGYEVIAYYNKPANNGETPKLIYVEPANNRIIEILGENIADYDVAAGRLYYYTSITSGKQKSIKIDLNTDNFIYNNIRSTSVTEAKLESADRIFAIDNNRDGDYDVIIIECEMVVMVKSTDESNSLIYSNYPLYDSNGNAMGAALDIENVGMSKVTTLTDRYGNDIDLSALSFGSVLNIVRSDVDAAGSSITTITVTNQSVTGTISEIGTADNGRTELVIDGVKYVYAKNEKDITERADIAIGNKYTFYLDVNNYIAGMGKATTSDMYGFLVKAGYSTGMDTMPEVKIFTTGGQFVTYKFADNAKINGKSNFASQDDVIREFFNVGQSVKVDLSRSRGIIAKPITYKVNSKGLISKMIVAKDNTGITLDEYYKLSTTENQMIKYPLTFNPVYVRNSLIFEGQFKISSGTKIFLVPELEMEETSPVIVPDKLKESTINRYDDIKNFSMGNVDSFKSYSNISKEEASFYDLNTERVAGMSVYQRSSTENQLSRSTGITIVKKINEVILSDGMNGYKLYGMRSGSEVEVIISNEEETYSVETVNGTPVLSRIFIKDGTQYRQTVEQGDIIRFVTNDDGELCDYEKVYDFSDDDNPDVMRKYMYASMKKEDLSVDSEGEYVDENAYANESMKNIPAMISITERWNTDSGKGFYAIFHHSNQYYYYGASFKLLYAEALDIIGDTLVYEVQANKENCYTSLTQEVAAINNFKVSIIDATEDEMKFYTGSRADIVPRSVYGEDATGTMMLVYISDASPREIILIRK